MKFLFRLACMAIVSASCLAHAGYFTIVSRSTYASGNTVSLPSHTTSVTYPTGLVGPAGFGLDLSMYPNPPSNGIYSGGGIAFHQCNFVVEWHPAPGDPSIPQVWPAEWTVHQTGSAGASVNWLAPFSTSYFNLNASLAPDAANVSFMDTFNIGHQSMTPFNEVTYDYNYGSFTFYSSGGSVYASGTFTIAFELDITGFVSAMESGGLVADLVQTMTLTSINGHPIL